MTDRSGFSRALLLSVALALPPGLANGSQLYGYFILVSADTDIGIGSSYQSAGTGPLQDEQLPILPPSTLPPLYGKYVVDYGTISVYANNNGTAPLYTSFQDPERTTS